MHFSRVPVDTSTDTQQTTLQTNMICNSTRFVFIPVEVCNGIWMCLQGCHSLDITRSFLQLEKQVSISCDVISLRNILGLFWDLWACLRYLVAAAQHSLLLLAWCNSPTSVSTPHTHCFRPRMWSCDVMASYEFDLAIWLSDESKSSLHKMIPNK